MKQLYLIPFTFFICATLSAKEYHVAKTCNNHNNRTQEAPFLTIQSSKEFAVNASHHRVVENLNQIESFIRRAKPKKLK